MLSTLKVLNLPAGTKLIKKELGDTFILSTCQRTLILGFHLAPFTYIDKDAKFECFEGEDAYQFLLETICGLKSQVLGEYEVVGQFKKAYQDFLQLPFKQSQIIQVIEKLFKDSKEIRTLFLTEIGQLSYAGIARKILHMDTKKINEETSVLITGTGELAEDLIKLLKKKNNVIVSGRNQKRLNELKELYQIEILNWNDYSQFFIYSNIVNTIGADEIIFDSHFIEKWYEINSNKQALFIDLGSPSALAPKDEIKLSKEQGLLRLEDIFKESAKLTHEKMEKIEKAEAHIKNLVQKRKHSFMITNASTWEAFSFESAL